jgi:ribosomal-protein-alanine N-acetyltransferase
MGETLPSGKIGQPMPERWTERLPSLPGDLTTLREIAVSDVHTLFALFSDPAISAHMAPPPPTLAKFAGFVAWSHQQREQGHGLCFGIVPDGMTEAVGILQVRFPDSTASSAEWGFVLSSHFWSTGVFRDAANIFLAFAFTTLKIEHLEARIALRNRRAHAAVQRLGASAESTLASMSPMGLPRDPQIVWTLCERDWRERTRELQTSPDDVRQRIRQAVEAAQNEVRRSESPEAVEPYPLFLFDRRRQE